MSEPWKRVRGCPVCGKSRCLVSPDEKACYCFREGKVVHLEHTPSRVQFLPGDYEDQLANKEDHGPRIKPIDPHAEMLDTAYRAFLQPLTLDADHKEEFVCRRKMTNNEIEEINVRTVPEDTDERRAIFENVLAAVGKQNIGKVPGIHARKKTIAAPPGQIMVIPIYDPYHRIVALRYTFSNEDPRREVKKYTWASGYGGARLPKGARLLIQRPVRQDDERVWITEGEFKSVILANRKNCIVISIPGVSPPGKQQVKELLEALPLCERPSKVVIAFDQDKNPKVAKGKQDLANTINEHGFMVEEAFWDSIHKGIDDALVDGVDVQTRPIKITNKHQNTTKRCKVTRTHLNNDDDSDDDEENAVKSAVDQKTELQEKRIRRGRLTAQELHKRNMRPSPHISDKDAELLAIEYFPHLATYQEKRDISLREQLAHLPRGHDEEDHYAISLSGCLTVQHWGQCIRTKKLMTRKKRIPCRLNYCPCCRSWEAYMASEYALSHQQSEFQWPEKITRAIWEWDMIRPTDEPGGAIKWEEDKAQRRRMRAALKKNGISGALILINPQKGYILYLPHKKGLRTKLQNAGLVKAENLTREKALTHYNFDVKAVSEFHEEEIMRTDVSDEDDLNLLRNRWAYCPEMRRHKHVRRMRGAMPSGLSDEQHKRAQEIRCKEIEREMRERGVEPKPEIHNCEDHEDNDVPCDIEWVISHVPTKTIMHIQRTKPTRREALEIIKRTIPIMSAATMVAAPT